MTRWSRGVDVIATVVASRASNEFAIVTALCEDAITSDGEARGGRSADIALELSRGRGENASATVLVSQAAVAVNAVLCSSKSWMKIWSELRIDDEALQHIP